MNLPNIRIAIFASGTGSNAAQIIKHFEPVSDIEVALIVSNRANAGVLTLADEAKVSTHLIQRSNFYESEALLDVLASHRIDYIILAGFLWLIPPYLVRNFDKRMLNIHPALLPKYGGKGMYGMHIHRAVKAAGEVESGISIHLVNEAFDEGTLIFQSKCSLNASDEPETIRQKVLALEHKYFAPVIEGYIRDHQELSDPVQAD